MGWYAIKPTNQPTNQNPREIIIIIIIIVI